MRLLLDTHAFIWWDADPQKMSSRAYSACMDSSNTLHLSLASVWEMQIKVQLGKLDLRLPLAHLIRDHQARNGLVLEGIELPDILRLETLPMHHRDPFDRMIIAQTMERGFHLVACDSEFSAYGVPLFW
jgi:PIN domain nuclease of toxin-antitoxin system